MCCSRQAVDRRRVLGARCVEPFCCVCSWGRGVQGKLEGRTRTHLNISMTRGNLPPRKPILRDISMGGVRQFPGETVSFPPRHTTRYCTQAKKTERSSHHGGEDGRSFRNFNDPQKFSHGSLFAEVDCLASDFGFSDS